MCASIREVVVLPLVPVIAAIFGSGGHADDVLRDFPNDHAFAPISHTHTFVQYVSEVVAAAFTAEPWRARYMRTARGSAPPLFTATDSWERAVPATLTLVCVCFGVTRADRSDDVGRQGVLHPTHWCTSEDVLGSTNQRLHLPQ